MKKLVALLVVMWMGTAWAWVECGFSNESDIHQGNFQLEDPVVFAYNAVGGGAVDEQDLFWINCFSDPATPPTVVYTSLTGSSVTLQWDGHGLNNTFSDHLELTYEETYDPDPWTPTGMLVREYHMYLSLVPDPEQWDAPAGSYSGQLVYQFDYF